VYGAARTLWPFVTALVLAAWAAHLLRPAFRRLSGWLHGRQTGAAVLTVALLLVLVAPLAVAVIALVPAARSLLEQLRTSGNPLQALVSGDASGQSVDVMQLIREHGMNASRLVAAIGSASIQAIVGVFVFFVVFFGCLVQQEPLARWLERNAPLDGDSLHRLTAAFFEAGRGLLIGNGLTALAQGGIATVTYFALGVPRAALLGVLTVVGALIPLTGPAIVWLPVAAGLLLTGSAIKAAILTAVGVVVVGTVDNVLRPYLAKRAHVGLDTSVVIVAMFGGMALFGAWGLLLGPLVVRLAVEALAIVRERGLVFGAKERR
jgi:predicted PurR-regulated permease PerM